MREAAVTMVICFALRRTVDMKSSGQKIRKSRTRRVLKARQLRNERWQQTREEQGEAIAFSKKFFFFFFLLREDPELAKYNSPGPFGAGAKGPTHSNRLVAGDRRKSRLFDYSQQQPHCATVPLRSASCA